MISEEEEKEERMDTTQDFEPVQAGQQMLALMGAAAQWWAWMPWAAWLPPASQGGTATPEPQADPVPRAAPAPIEPVAAVVTDDDLTRIEGIGPRIATLLKEAGITGFAALAAAHAEQLAAVLAAAGPRFRLAQPASWPQQAALLAAGDEAGFAALAAELKGGVRR